MSRFDRFWNEFIRFEAGLRDVSRYERQRELWTADWNRLQAAINEVDDLILEVGLSEDVSTLIVSADGARDLFPAVRECVEAAPAVAGWDIKAFRQRGSVDQAIEMFGKSIDTDSVRLIFEPADDKLDVWVLIGADLAENELGMLGFILLDHLLGELDVETKLAGITPQEWPQDRDWPDEALDPAAAVEEFDRYFIQPGRPARPN